MVHPRYMNWWTAFSLVPLMVMWGIYWIYWYSSRGAGWWKTSVFFKLTKSKELGSLCKPFGVGNEGSVISEEKVMEQLLKCFCVGMQSAEVKQTTIKTVMNVYSTVIIKVFYHLFKHHAEKDAEQSRCQNTTLFHAIDDREGSWEVAVQPNLTVLVFVQLDNHADEICGAPKHFMIIHSPFLLTVSNALVKFTNTTYSLCSAPCISLGAIWGWKPCLWCSYWLGTHTGFLVDGLQWWWVPICLGAHK